MNRTITLNTHNPLSAATQSSPSSVPPDFSSPRLPASVLAVWPSCRLAISGPRPRRPHLLTRALENILDDALRYTPPGGAVAVTLTPHPGRVAIQVADTGPGIPLKDLPNIFAPLYRGETSRNRKTGGAGLGLAVSHRVLLAHSGTLAAANAPTGGVLFTSTLPTTNLNGA